MAHFLQLAFSQVWPSRVATCQSLVGCWGTRVVFFMANHRSTRVQRICKKLQTVRGAGGQLLGFFFRAVRRYFQEGSQQRKEGRATGGESPLTTVRDSGEYFLGAWAGSFLEGVFHLSETKF